MDDNTAKSLNAAAIRQAEALEQIAKTLQSMAATQNKMMVEMTNLVSAIRSRH